MRYARKIGLSVLYRQERIKSVIRGYMCLPLLYHGLIIENFRRINYEILDSDTGLYARIHIYIYIYIYNI